MVEFIRKNFVPVATDLRVYERTRQFLPDDIATERQLQQSWGIMRYRPIGIHVVGHDGTLIASSACPAEAGAVLQFLLRALESQPTLPPRYATPALLTPNRGYGLRPDGSIRLAVTIRSMDHGRASGRPVLDSILLTAAQMKALTPPHAVQGAHYRLPDVTSREFVRALTDAADLADALRPQDATVVQVDAEVVSVSGAELLVQVHGTLGGARHVAGAQRDNVASGSAVGLVSFSGNRLKSLKIVCDGEFQNDWANTAHTIGGLIEWRVDPQ